MRTLFFMTAIAAMVAGNAVADDEAKTDAQELTETVFGSAEDHPNELIDIAEFVNFGNLIFGSMDYDSNHSVTFEEFTGFDFGYKFIAQETGKTPAYLTAQRVVFSFWDRNGDAEISASEWRSAMNVDFQRADQDNNALLSRDEFSNHYIVNQAYQAALYESSDTANACSRETELRNKSLIQSFIQEGQSARNLQVVGEYLGEKFTDHSARGRSDPRSSREQSLAFHEALFAAFPDFRVEVHQQIAECDKVVTYKTFHGTQEGDLLGFPATGQKVEIDVIDILRIENGEVMDHWVVNNMVGTLITGQGQPE